MRSILFLVLMSAILAFPAPTRAKDEKPKSSGLPPIEMRMKWGMVRYQIGDRKLDRYHDLRPVLQGLGDEETLKLLDRSQSLHRAGFLFSLTGGAVAGYSLGTVWFGDNHWKDSKVQVPFWSGMGVAFIGGIMHNSAESRKFDAVQRYNKLARGEEKSSWRLQSRGPGLVVSVVF